jgi:hypothetical protein
MTRDRWPSKDNTFDVELTLQGKTDSAVVIKGIQIRIVKKVEPTAGTHVVAWGECGGNDDSQYLVGKLDDLPPQIYDGVSEWNNGVEVVHQKSSRSLSAKSFYVSKSDPQKFILVAYGSKYDYTWELAIRWLDPDGSEHVTTVRNEEGGPFSSAARKSKTVYRNAPTADNEVTWQESAPMYGG